MRSLFPRDRAVIIEARHEIHSYMYFGGRLRAFSSGPDNVAYFSRELEFLRPDGAQFRIFHGNGFIFGERRVCRASRVFLKIFRISQGAKRIRGRDTEK